MKKIEIGSAVIEVTRKCNMSCAHCLRGDAENLKIHPDYIESFLSQVSYISNVTFSGGEPSLNVEAIQYFLDCAKERGVEIGSFYIATNGLNIKEDFVLTCLRLWNYCSSNELSAVDVSNDMYHAAEGSYDTELLDGLSFFHRKYEKEGYDYDNDRYLILQGNAERYTNAASEEVEHHINSNDDFMDANIYLNCRGKIINGCDWSYDNQDDYILCDVDDLIKYHNTLDNEEY